VWVRFPLPAPSEHPTSSVGIAQTLKIPWFSAEIQLQSVRCRPAAAEPKLGYKMGYRRYETHDTPARYPTMPPLLTETAVKAVKPEAKARKIYDERGLYLFVPPTGARLWRVRRQD
jgi:hypothetical protein